MSGITTTGKLRAFLAKSIEDLQKGGLSPEQAQQIAKVAAQIHKSMQVEVQAMRALVESGQDVKPFGSMNVGED